MVPEFVLYPLGIFLSVLLGAVWYFARGGQRYYALYSATAGIMLLVLTIGLLIRNSWVAAEKKAKTPAYFGELVPADENPLMSTIPPSAFSLLLGDDLQVLSASSNQKVLSHKGTPFLSIGFENGRMWLSTTVVDSHDRNVVRVIRNEFQAYPEGAFNPRQPDEHSLVVRDTDGVEVLNIRFQNPRRIRIVGRFYLEGSGTVTIDAKDGIRFPGSGQVGHLTLNMTMVPNAGAMNFN